MFDGRTLLYFAIHGERTDALRIHLRFSPLRPSSLSFLSKASKAIAPTISSPSTPNTVLLPATNVGVPSAPMLMASLRPVTVGLVEGNDASIDKGVQAGDNVVIDGADKLQDGNPVVVPSSTTTPSPGGAPSGSDKKSNPKPNA